MPDPRTFALLAALLWAIVASLAWADRRRRHRRARAAMIRLRAERDEARNDLWNMKGERP